MYMYLLSYCAKLGLEKTDNHFQCFSSYTHKSHKPSRSDWQVHSTISSDFISAQCVQSIHTDHNLRPWSAQSNNSTHPNTAAEDVRVCSWQNWSSISVTTEHVVSCHKNIDLYSVNVPFKIVHLTYPRSQAPALTFGFTWPSLVKSYLSLGKLEVNTSSCFPSLVPRYSENFSEQVGMRVAVHSSLTVK